MALSWSMRLPATPPAKFRTPRLRVGPPRVSLASSRWPARRFRTINTLIRAVEGSKESETETPAGEAAAEESRTAELSEIGAEIKAALQQRKEKAENDLVSGVGEEVREIEWPAFGKVLGTTGVVLGVIAGSSVALLTVNAVLAELSDKVFAGKGVQDLFG